MASARPSARDLLRGLSALGLFSESRVPEVSRVLGTDQARPSPWHLQVLMGLGAWISAVCFIAYLMNSRIVTTPTMIQAGLILVGAAIIVRRLSGQALLAQLCMAVSAAGQTLFLVGIGERTHEILPVALASVALAAVHYFLYTDPLHRFLSTFSALMLVLSWIVQDRVPNGIYALVFVETVGAGIVFISHRLPWAFRPLAYACAFSLPVTLSFTALAQFGTAGPDLPSRAILAAGLLGLIAWASGGRRETGRPGILMAILGTLVLAVVSSSGILASLGLLVLGYACRDRVLPLLGVVSLGTFIVMFYYDLDMNLGLKSALLAASGLVLLVCRWYLSRREAS